MLTITANAPFEVEKGVIKEAEPFVIAVPTNNFEGSFLRQFVLTVIGNHFAINTLTKAKDEKGLKGVKQRSKLFVKFCDNVQYDKWGRFYFDPTQSGKFDPKNPDMISFFVVVSAFGGPGPASSYGSECEHLVDDDNSGEEETDDEQVEKTIEVIPESIVFQYSVYAQQSGVLFKIDWLFPELWKMAKKISTKKSSGG